MLCDAAGWVVINIYNSTGGALNLDLSSVHGTLMGNGSRTVPAYQTGVVGGFQSATYGPWVSFTVKNGSTQVASFTAGQDYTFAKAGAVKVEDISSSGGFNVTWWGSAGSFADNTPGQITVMISN